MPTNKDDRKESKSWFKIWAKKLEYWRVLHRCDYNPLRIERITDVLEMYYWIQLSVNISVVQTDHRHIPSNFP